MKQNGRTSKVKSVFLIAALLASFSILAHSDDIEGIVERVDDKAKTFVIKGQTIYVDVSTKYDHGLTGFEQIKIGDRLEVDIYEKDGRKVAHEIDREDS